MAILNLTPDSFSDGSPGAAVTDFLERAARFIGEGADIIDIGAESTRPGAKPVPVSEELKRILPFLEKFRERYPSYPLSLDTRKYEVAEKAISYGIAMLNDVSFLSDPLLAGLAMKNDACYVLMHSRGTPSDMAGLTDYPGGLLETIFAEMAEKITSLKKMGFPMGKLILDPGFGFAKTPEQCQTLMENLSPWREFALQHCQNEALQLMIGISRKRFLQLHVGDKPPLERDEISASLAAKAVQEGFQIIRTHNVALTRRALACTHVYP